MREWLTVIIVLLILGVLLDGWRRMRQSKRHSIKMSIKPNKDTGKETDEGYGSELPNGGARVVGQRDDDNAREVPQSAQETFGLSKTALRPRTPEQVSLNLDEEVPMLMDSVEEESRREPSLHAHTDDVAPTDEPAYIRAEDDEADYQSQPSFESKIDETDDWSPEPDFVSEPKPNFVSESEPELEQEPEEVLVINVMSVGNDRFQGGELLEVIVECGMRYGDMQIFHRHHGEDGEGPLLFSMVNMVVPGTFDLNAMNEFETPGVSLFMTLPMNANSMEAFNIMADSAKAIATRLGGELKDEHRSVMTAQTIEHCRHRVREFERKQLSRA